MNKQQIKEMESVFKDYTKLLKLIERYKLKRETFDLEESLEIVEQELFKMLGVERK